MAYEIEGKLLEVCTCNVLCPCWVGEDPDYKTCDSTIGWGIEKGSIEGVDVDGLTLAVSAHIPRNILDPEVLEGRRARRRASDAPSRSGALLKAVHRPARRRDRRPRRPDRRGRRRRARADHLHRRGRQRPAAHRHDRRRRDGAVHGRDRQSDHALPRPRSQHDPGLAGLCGQGQQVHAATAATHGIPSVDLKGNNALQGHFRFAA